MAVETQARSGDQTRALSGNTATISTEDSVVPAGDLSRKFAKVVFPGLFGVFLCCGKTVLFLPLKAVILIWWVVTQKWVSDPFSMDREPMPGQKKNFRKKVLCFYFYAVECHLFKLLTIGSDNTCGIN